MYHRNSINVIYRLIAFLLLALTILFINNTYILGIITIGFVFLDHKRNPLLLIMWLVSLLLTLVRFFISDSIFINIMLILDFLVLFIIDIDKYDLLLTKRLIMNKPFTFDELYKNYYEKADIKNNEVLDEYIKDNRIEENDRIKEIKGSLIKKNKSDANNMIMVNYLRFYKNRNDLIDYLGLNRDTIIYLGAHAIILLLVMVIDL